MFVCFVIIYTHCSFHCADKLFVNQSMLLKGALLHHYALNSSIAVSRHTSVYTDQNWVCDLHSIPQIK